MATSSHKRKLSILTMVMKNNEVLNEMLINTDSEDEEEEIIHAKCLQIQNKRVCIKNYAEITVHSYSDKSFQSHFRLTRVSFQVLLEKIGYSLENHERGQTSVSAEKQLLMTIWLLGNLETYRSIADRFDVSKSTLWTTCEKVIASLLNISPTIIRWPRGNEEINKIKKGFEDIAGFIGVIGAIDGTHIAIKAPETDPASYVNRKGYHSVILQGVCDSTKKFIDCFAGCPGSLHDARVFRLSDLYRKLQSSFISSELHLLGDPAYPVSNYMIAPFKDNGHLTHKQKKFNKCLSATRSRIENSFSLLKGRFRRLKLLDMSRMDLIPKTILAACVLHNICLDHETDFEEYMEEHDEDASSAEPESSEESDTKRDFIMNLMFP